MRRSVSVSQHAVLASALLLLLVIAPTRGAQEQAAPPLVLDLQRLLFETDRRDIQDPVWELTPAVGKQFVLVPFTVNPVERKTEIARPPINLRGGRFIGFMVPEPTDQGASFESPIDFAMFTDQTPGALDRLLFTPSEEEGWQDGPGFFDPSFSDDEFSDEGFPDPGGFDIDDPDGFGEEAFSAKPPRLAKKIYLEADGSVRWGMERSIASAELRPGSEQNLYPFKLDSAMLREKEPPRAERLTRNDGESSREFAERRRQQQREHRAKVDEFRALRDALRELPEQFSEPSPAVIYAVVEVREGEGLSLQGPPPMPWKLADADRELLARAAQLGGRGGNGQRQVMAGLGRLAGSRHAVDAQAAALAVLKGGFADAVEENDPSFQLISKLLVSDDPTARRIAVYAVARAQTPTRATARLLEIAGQAATGGDREVLRLAALRSLFAIELANAEGTNYLVQQVNLALADPEGPAASRVLEELLRAVGGSGAHGDFESTNRVRVVLINRLNFAAIPEDQTDAVIEAVLRQAPGNDVAAGWLDVRLLRSDNPARVTRTLELLGRAEVVPPISEAIVRAFESLIFSVPLNDEPAPDDGTLRLPGRIAMASTNHGLARALESAEANQQELAWAALRHFRVTPAENGSFGINGSDSAIKAFESILGRGMDLDATPATLVDFVDNHAGTEVGEAAALGMLRLLTDPDIDPAVARLAAERIVGSRLAFEQVLTGLAPTQQLTVVNALYTQLRGDVPLVAGLIAEPGGGLSRWFAQRLAAGELPTGRQWAAQLGGPTAGGEQQLLRWAASEDPNTASAAAAALASNAGGTADDQQRFAQAVAAMTDRTEESVGQAWSALRTRLYSQALADAAGSYKLVVTLTETDNGFSEFDLSGGQGGTPAKRIDLGTVELKASGTSISLSAASIRVAVSPDRLAIRLQSLASLRTLNNPGLAGLPLSQLDQPLDLVPQEDGAWTGTTQLPDGRELGVALEPAG